MEAKTELQYAQVWIQSLSDDQIEEIHERLNSEWNTLPENTSQDDRLLFLYRKAVVEPWCIRFYMKKYDFDEMTAFKYYDRHLNQRDSFEYYRREVLEKEAAPTISEDKEAGWISSEVELPYGGENVEISDDGITVRETADYKTDRRCMMAGIAGGNGYFGSLGFATDGSTGCETNLILDTPAFWRRYDTSPSSEKQPEDNVCSWCDGLHQDKPVCPICTIDPASSKKQPEGTTMVINPPNPACTLCGGAGKIPVSNPTAGTTTYANCHCNGSIDFSPLSQSSVTDFKPCGTEDNHCNCQSFSECGYNDIAQGLEALYLRDQNKHDDAEIEEMAHDFESQRLNFPQSSVTEEGKTNAKLKIVALMQHRNTRHDAIDIVNKHFAQYENEVGLNAYTENALQNIVRDIMNMPQRSPFNTNTQSDGNDPMPGN